jgi:hypothetical protein
MNFKINCMKYMQDNNNEGIITVRSKREGNTGYDAADSQVVVYSYSSYYEPGRSINLISKKLPGGI